MLDPRFKSLKFLPSLERSTVYAHLNVAASEINVLSEPSEKSQPGVLPSSKCFKHFVGLDKTFKTLVKTFLLDFSESSDTNSSSPESSTVDAAERKVSTYRAEEEVPKTANPSEW